MLIKQNFILKSEKIDELYLWHLRYGHINYKELDLLKKKNMIFGLLSIEKGEQIYEDYIYGTLHWLPFPKIAWGAWAPLELVHIDICDPIRTFNQKRYFSLFVDNYSRMIWVYFLEQKLEAFSSFLQFKAYVKWQSGYQMKTLRIDRGGEFISTPFINYYKEKGFKKQLIVHHMPELNRVIECKNWTIVEMAWSILKEKELPNKFWIEVVNIAVFIFY